MTEALKHHHRHYHPNIQRWMLFVDGENFTIRAQDIAKEKGLELIQGDYYEPDVYVWPSLMLQVEIIIDGLLKKAPIRSYYYTSVVGDDNRVNEIKNRLWRIGFHPEVFKKIKGRKSKGVDITLTKDVLSHAFLNNYDLAVLLAGDADYLPLINEIKRIGKLVYLVFHEDAIVDENLIRAADLYEGISIHRFELSNQKGILKKDKLPSKKKI